MPARFAALVAGIALLAPTVWGQAVPPADGQARPGPRGAELVRLLDRPRVPLDVRAKGPAKAGAGLVVEALDFATEAHPDGTVERVPALVVRPADPEGSAPVRRPAVIALHGTGGNKEGMRPWLDDLARRGCVAVAIDGRYHGERAGGRPGTEAYNDAIVRAWRAKPGEPMEHPLYLDTVWDVWRAVDYLAARPDVDPGRVGLIGISKGGIETWLAGAADPRIRVAVPAIAVQSFRWGLDHDRWKARAHTVRAAHEAAARDRGEPEITRETCRALWDKVLPGILDRFDGPSLLPEFAGRRLLIVSGELDPNCPIEGAEIAFAAARDAFRRAGADDHLRIMVAPKVGHAVTPDQRVAALDWLTTGLKAAAPATSPVPAPSP